MKRFLVASLLVGLAAIVGCKNANNHEEEHYRSSIEASGFTFMDDLPIFSLATSNYTSWTTFMAAWKLGLINPANGGEHGELEKKWNVDVVIYVKDYQDCLTSYSKQAFGAVCVTNVDSLNLASVRPSTAILPTSISNGADKLIAVGVENLDGLKGVNVYGPSNTVSEYMFLKTVDGKSSKGDYIFHNLEQSASAMALQTGSNDIKAICVREPFALQTMQIVSNSVALADSSTMSEEIIDMVIVANDTLERTGGEDFASCLCDIFYQVCDHLKNPETATETLTAMGEEYSNFSADDMSECLKGIKLINDSKAGVALFGGPELPSTMAAVSDYCKQSKIIPDPAPEIGYNNESSQLNFSTKYMNSLQK